MMARALIAALLVLLVGSATARAERLIVSVSNHRVTVTPNYSGEELVLFGSVERDASTPAARTAYDLVVTVMGPRADMVTRRKERKFGIWINTDYRQFLQVPSYLALFANRPFEEIASTEVARRQQLGLNNVLLTQRVGTDYADVVPTRCVSSTLLSPSCSRSGSAPTTRTWCRTTRSAQPSSGCAPSAGSIARILPR